MNDKVKIAQVSFSLDHGGAEMMIFDLVSGLDRAEFSPVICSSQYGGTLKSEIESTGVPVFEVYNAPGKDFRFFFKLYRFFKSLGIEIVHAHNGYMWLYSTIPARLAGARVVYTEHSVHENPSRLFLLWSKLMERLTDKIVVPSKHVRNLLHRRQHVDTSGVKVIYNGVNISRIDKKFDADAKRSELNISPGVKIIGIVARLVPVKNHECLIDAMEIIASRMYKCHLLIIGDGPRRTFLEKKVQDLGLGSIVSFMGNRKDVPELLKIMDLFVLCSNSEGFPVSILEAMAAGVPVVATNVGGVKEALADGLAGRLVSPANPKELADAMMEVLADPDTRRKFKEAARELINEYFSVDIMVRRYMDVYRWVLK